MQRLAAEKGQGKQARRKPGGRRYVLHVDFDSFFAAVSLKKNPEYVDKPAVVAHSTGTGSEIASCNYPAREFGVKNGMWMKRALELCPDLKVLPYDFPAYEEASRCFYEAILEMGGTVQSVSVDEALVDVTSTILNATGSQGVGVDEGSIWREQEKADQFANTLRNNIKVATGCDVSVGIGGNILQAKVALRKAKPAGQYQLKPEDVLDVIGELEVERLPGVAYSLGGKLEEAGVKLVKDIREISKERLTSILGPKTAEKLRDYSRGIDKAEVGEQPPRKSVSAEVNWGIRFISQSEAEEFIYNLCKELEKRLLNEQVKGRQMTMKIMRRSLDAPLDPAKHLGHGKCDTFNKSTSFGVATHSSETIGKEAVAILRSFRFSPGDLRGLGVQMTKLEPIKAIHAGPEGSQRKLTFNAFPGRTTSRKSSGAEAIDDGDNHHLGSSHHGFSAMDHDPIAEDPLTPRKEKVHPAMALARAARSDTKAQTPLNVSGTQFLIPSNVDPATIAELPNDIRSRFMKLTAPAVDSRSNSPVHESRATSPEADVLPSQVDPEVFNELPDDVKSEILASYRRRQPSKAVPHASPRKDRTLEPKKQITPTKRRGIQSVFGKAQRQRDAQAGLLQTNFCGPRVGSEDPPATEIVEELDPAFLAELPEDVRKEVIEDHKRQRLAQRSGLEAPARRAPLADPEAILPGGQRRIQFPAPPPKVSFTSSGVTSAREIKDMLDAWHSETSASGPHRSDVEVFEKYLVKVVEEERDLEKVSKLVKWLDVLAAQDSRGGRGEKAWKKTVAGVKDVVQQAVARRGLAPLSI
jgi:DNA repair protein REV1